MSGLVARVGLVSAVFLWIAGGGERPPDVPRRGEWLEKEIALGKAMAAQIERQTPMDADPGTGAYVRQLGERLARASATDLPLTIQVTSSQEPYAIVLAGGFLYLSAGLITSLETEAELAGLMAHAVAHMAAHHGRRLAAFSQPPDSAVPIVFLGSWGGICTRLGSGSAAPVAWRRFARAFEDEADWLALEYLYQTEYDPRGLISGFQRLSPARAYEAPVGAVKRGFRERLEDLLRGMPECVVSTSAFDQVKARLKAAPGR